MSVNFTWSRWSLRDQWVTGHPVKLALFVIEIIYEDPCDAVVVCPDVIHVKVMYGKMGREKKLLENQGTRVGSLVSAVVVGVMIVEVMVVIVVRIDA